LITAYITGGLPAIDTCAKKHPYMQTLIRINRFWFLILPAFFAILSCQGAKEGKRPAAIDTNSVYYNSRDSFCKSPFGAVPAGTKITLRFLAKEASLQSVAIQVVKTTIFGNNQNTSHTNHASFPMEKKGVTNGQDIFEASFALQDPSLYGYYFKLTGSQGETGSYCNNTTAVQVPTVRIRGAGGLGELIASDRSVTYYSLTVYDPGFQIPEWTRDMVIYYIFPDRFKNGNKSNDPGVGVRKFYGTRNIEFHTNWCDPEPYVPRDGKSDGEYCNDFYGGDLDGIIQKLDYIRDLGANVIYINPIFQAPSNHKYDTQDYMTVDESFGTLETFKKLVAESKKRNMRIILDTSLNHCGSDSIYMDRYAKYNSNGAFVKEKINTNSPYYEWFEWNTQARTPDRMYSQWSNPTLATLREVDAYKQFAYRDKNSVTKYWLSLGIGGWRMDVTPWKSDDFWRDWRKEVKKDYPEAFTIAEVWFDASKYFTGDMYDSTMNYLFRAAALNFAGGGNASMTGNTLEMLRENYPKPVFYHLMNLVSSHDLPRALFDLGYKKYGTSNYGEMRRRLLLCFALQFTYPGAPTIYYGDEVGMTGGPDPMNRGPYPWKEDGGNYGDYSLIDVVKALSRMRRENPVLIGGELRMLPGDKNILAYERTDSKSRIMVVMNNANEPKTFRADNGSAGWKTLSSEGPISIRDNGDFSVPATGYLVMKAE
jgi:glycosidase